MEHEKDEFIIVPDYDDNGDLAPSSPPESSEGSQATLDINELPFNEAQAKVVIAAMTQYMQDFFYCTTEYGVSSTGLFAMFFRAQAYQYHMLLKMGAGSLLTPAQLRWAEWYERTEFAVNYALVGPFITSAISSGIEVTNKSIKYAPAFQKTASRALRKLRAKQSKTFDTVEFLENKAKEKQGVFLIKVAIEPTAGNLIALLPRESNLAYIRYENQLFYANKQDRTCEKLSLSDEKLDKFDKTLRVTTLERSRQLRNADLAKIAIITATPLVTVQVTTPSLIRKQSQQSIRFTGMMIALIVGGLVTGLAAPFLVGYLLPLVGGGAAIAIAAIISAVFIARLSLIVIKHSQRFYNKVTSGRAWGEIYDLDLKQMNEMVVTLGLENSPWQKSGLPKWFRAMHLHWSSGDTNATAGYNSWLPQSALGVIYRKRQSYTLWFQIAGIGLGVLVAFALLALTLSIPIAPWLLIAGAALTGLVLGDRLADGFAHYKGIATTNTSSWLGVAVIVAGISIFVALGFGWPLVAVAAPAAVVVTVLTIKLLYEQVRSKTKNQLLEGTLTESAISILLRDKQPRENTVEKQAVLDYLAVIHKQAYENYQKNATKLQRLGLLSYILNEIIKSYITAWNDINKYVVTDAAFENKPVLRGVINYVLRPPVVIVVGTLRTIFAAWWSIFPMARLYNYIEACRVDINAAPNDMVPSIFRRFAYFIGLVSSDIKPNYPPTKFEKIVTSIIGGLFVIVNPFYGSSYQLKQAAYQIKKADNKEALRLAEEAYHLIANTDDVTYKMEGEHKLQIANSTNAGYKGKINGLLARIDELDTSRCRYLEAKKEYIKKRDNANPTQEARQMPQLVLTRESDTQQKPEMQRLPSFEKTEDERKEIKVNRRFTRACYYLGLSNTHSNDFTGKEERLHCKVESVRPSRVVV